MTKRKNASKRNQLLILDDCQPMNFSPLFNSLFMHGRYDRYTHFNSRINEFYIYDSVDERILNRILERQSRNNQVKLEIKVDGIDVTMVVNM